VVYWRHIAVLIHLLPFENKLSPKTGDRQPLIAKKRLKIVAKNHWRQASRYQAPQ
jgi:hypothetical protein